MIELYNNGELFIKDNKEFLETNINLSTFFFLDAPLLKEVDKINYALKCIHKDKKLVVLKVEPYNLMLFGDYECCNEVIYFLLDNGYEIKNILAEEKVGKEVINSFHNRGISYDISLTMDFMLCDKITSTTDKDVLHATAGDIDELFEYTKNFMKDCGLFDEVRRENIANTIDQYRIIKVDGKIASIAKFASSLEGFGRISEVYTLDSFRGKGYARKVVNAVKNEMIESGLIATLNVDRINPISNHLYSSLGFTKTFSQVLLIRK